MEDGYEISVLEVNDTAPPEITWFRQGGTEEVKIRAKIVGELGQNVTPMSAFFESQGDAWLSWIALMKSNPCIKFSLLNEAGEVLAEYTPS